LKLKCDEPLSNFVFNFNLRRYIEAFVVYDAAGGSSASGFITGDVVGRCSLTVSKPELKARLVSALETKI